MTKRWNGWGLEGIQYPLPQSGYASLLQSMGQGATSADLQFDEAIRSVPASRIKPHPLISTEAADRLRHACGQSLPDWVALRCGGLKGYPDAVAFPKSNEDLRDLLHLAQQIGACVIPYGGGTSVVGHVNPLPEYSPCLTISLRGLNQLITIDPDSHLAVIGAGATGPEIETLLGRHGYTLGHYPQSWEHSTLGGWIATRSCGQQSYRYGRIEELFHGGHIETPVGQLELPPFPASAAGPDLREFFLGSEGRFGILSSAIMKISPLPEREYFSGVFFPDWHSGFSALKDIAQARLPVSMLRLSDSAETAVTLKLAGMDRWLKWLERGLNILNHGPERCLLIFAISGDRRHLRSTCSGLRSILRKHHGLIIGRPIGDRWRKNRFRSAYLRNTLWDVGYAVDTLETSVSWSAVDETKKGIHDALLSAFSWDDRKVLVFSHLSHVYPTGASIYVTYLFPRSEDHEQLLEQWRRMKTAASLTIREMGGTISHQHGVGMDHKPFLRAEKGDIGIDLIEAARIRVDPNGMMNPGKLIPEPLGR